MPSHRSVACAVSASERASHLWGRANPGRWLSNPAGEAARAAGDAPVAKAGGGVGKYVSAAPKRQAEAPAGAAVAKKAIYGDDVTV